MTAIARDDYYLQVPVAITQPFAAPGKGKICPNLKYGVAEVRNVRGRLLAEHALTPALLLTLQGLLRQGVVKAYSPSHQAFLEISPSDPRLVTGPSRPTALGVLRVIRGNLQPGTTATHLNYRSAQTENLIDESRISFYVNRDAIAPVGLRAGQLLFFYPLAKGAENMLLVNSFENDATDYVSHVNARHVGSVQALAFQLQQMVECGALGLCTRGRSALSQLAMTGLMPTGSVGVPSAEYMLGVHGQMREQLRLMPDRFAGATR